MSFLNIFSSFGASGSTTQDDCNFVHVEKNNHDDHDDHNDHDVHDDHDDYNNLVTNSFYNECATKRLTYNNTTIIREIKQVLYTFVYVDKNLDESEKILRSIHIQNYILVYHM